MHGGRVSQPEQRVGAMGRVVEQEGDEALDAHAETQHVQDDVGLRGGKSSTGSVSDGGQSWLRQTERGGGCRMVVGGTWETKYDPVSRPSASLTHTI